MFIQLNYNNNNAAFVMLFVEFYSLFLAYSAHETLTISHVFDRLIDHSSVRTWRKSFRKATFERKLSDVSNC